MLPSFFKQTVIRLRPGEKTERGSVVPDWTSPDKISISGCSMQPAATGLTQDGRVLGISDSWDLYMPYDADVIEGDRIEYGGVTYTVTGAPRLWESPTGNLSNRQVTLERWCG